MRSARRQMSGLQPCGPASHFGGVTFDDATTVKYLYHEDFSGIDEYCVRMIRAQGVQASTCHTTKFYENGVKLYEYENADAERW